MNQLQYNTMWRVGLSALQTQRLACEPITIQHNVACWSVIIANTEVSL